MTDNVRDCLIATGWAKADNGLAEEMFAIITLFAENDSELNGLMTTAKTRTTAVAETVIEGAI